MNWDAINFKAVLNVLRKLEDESVTINSSSKIVYSDKEEEVTIIYKRLK